jgi:hypothetical protein
LRCPTWAQFDQATVQHSFLSRAYASRRFGVLVHDVIVLFTDGEETSNIGAAAFRA